MLNWFFYSNKEDYGKDWIAQPMYSLIAEVFELTGVFKWLRRTLISFVQVTFGRSINKLVEIVYLLNLFQKYIFNLGNLGKQLSGFIQKIWFCTI